MSHFLGFGIVILLVGMAMESLGVERSFYFDDVALIIVIGGTFAIAIITNPLSQFLSIFTAPFKMLRRKKQNKNNMVEILVNAAKSRKLGRAALVQLLRDPKTSPFLKEGLELLLLDLKRDEFKSILTERIYRKRQRDDETVSLFRNLAKYPPGLGLVGTVLGLVNLMRSVGIGGNASEVGLKMALALIATLYGLALSNLYFVPLAEYFLREAEDEKVFLELQLEGLLMVFDARSELAVQEMLNSFVDAKSRVDIIGVHNVV